MSSKQLLNIRGVTLSGRGRKERTISVVTGNILEYRSKQGHQPRKGRVVGFDSATGEIVINRVYPQTNSPNWRITDNMVIGLGIDPVPSEFEVKIGNGNEGVVLSRYEFLAYDKDGSPSPARFMTYDAKANELVVEPCHEPDGHKWRIKPSSVLALNKAAERLIEEAA